MPYSIKECVRIANANAGKSLSEKEILKLFGYSLKTNLRDTKLVKRGYIVLNGTKPNKWPTLKQDA